jgi:hypothetical protein
MHHFLAFSHHLSAEQKKIHFTFFLSPFPDREKPGMPDGTFSNQKSKFG